MTSYIILYQYFESTKLGVVFAANEKRAISKFILRELRQANPHGKSKYIGWDSDLHFYYDDDKPLLPQIRAAAEEIEYFKVYPTDKEFIEGSYL